uniref:DNA repair protein XRCC1 n=1 Tax=Petromyzon marinus TaxID=7757 RepID=S4RX86_PETMA
MTEVTPVKVIHCSSQDTVATAENLLNTDADKPWKSKSYGEKQIIVTLQFEKPEQIHAVEIQNNGSAFVEVLGGNVKSFDQDYEVICAMSFFMSPGESKRAQNTDRVRIFGPEKLCRPAADKQFETVKIVCTQPYTKNLKFGLACIKFYSPPEPGTKWTGPSTSHLKDSPRGKKLAGFKIKEEDESEDIKPGALFFSKSSPPDHDSPKAKNSGPSCTTPTLTTEQSESPEGSPSAKQLEFSGSKQFSNKTNSGKRKADHSGETTPSSAKKDTPESSPKTKELHLAAKWHASACSCENPFTKQPTPVKHSSASQGTSGASRGPEGGGKAVEFGQLLRGVAFVLSGFQNPFRSDLRDKALALGAKYMPDWTDSSTHLICAFANTPKYNQVKSQGGIIVSKEWILDCYKRRQKLSHKRYLFDGASSEEEDDDEVETTAGKVQKISLYPRKLSMHSSMQESSSSSTPVKKHANGQGTSQKTAGIHKEAESDEDEKRDRDDLEARGRKSLELWRCLFRVIKYKPMGHQEAEEDIYDASTDENTDTEENGAKSSKSNGDESDEKEFPIPELPDFFTGKHFYFYGNFPGNERRTLCRYVVAFNGLLEEYMNERVNFVVSAQEWDENFYDALTENPNLAFVKPQWIYSCNSKGKRLPHQPFVVIPQE